MMPIKKIMVQGRKITVYEDISLHQAGALSFLPHAFQGALYELSVVDG
jgi:hypothetical protein